MAVINRYGLNGEEDFLGFSFNGRHSSEFKFIRVSKSDRYEDEVVPATKDTTIDIPGRDGALFINSKKQKKVWNISFAYDDMRKKDIDAIRNWLNCKTEAPLIFDEDVKKRYWVKVTGAVKLSYLAFDDDQIPVFDADGAITGYTTDTVYKGEGSVQFTAYNTEGESVQEIEINVLNDGAIEIDNQGDLLMPVQIELNYDGTDYIQLSLCKKSEDTNSETYLNHIFLKPRNDCKKYLIDSDLHLIFGYKVIGENGDNPTYELDKTQILNKMIVAGDFFSIPVGKYCIKTSAGTIVGVTGRYLYH